MKKLYEMKHMRNQISVLKSKAVNIQEWGVMTDRYNVTMSKKNALMVDDKGRLKFMMGKIDKDNYYMPCVEGVSPILLFAFGIMQFFK